MVNFPRVRLGHLERIMDLPRHPTQRDHGKWKRKSVKRDEEGRHFILDDDSLEIIRLNWKFYYLIMNTLRDLPQIVFLSKENKPQQICKDSYIREAYSPQLGAQGTSESMHYDNQSGKMSVS